MRRPRSKLCCGKVPASPPPGSPTSKQTEGRRGGSGVRRMRGDMRKLKRERVSMFSMQFPPPPSPPQTPSFPPSFHSSLIHALPFSLTPTNHLLIYLSIHLQVLSLSLHFSRLLSISLRFSHRPLLFLSFSLARSSLSPPAYRSVLTISYSYSELLLPTLSLALCTFSLSHMKHLTFLPARRAGSNRPKGPAGLAPSHPCPCTQLAVESPLPISKVHPLFLTTTLKKKWLLSVQQQRLSNPDTPPPIAL